MKTETGRSTNRSSGGRASSFGLRTSTFVYGPVPSRRLGLSLGINIIPRKTCTLDCVYCQCGRTTAKTVKRQSFYPVEDIVAQVRVAARGRKVDFLTFSGEGEPTLNQDIGRIIRITNSTLLTDPKVRHDLGAADLVVPSLDAADQRTFARVDRCHRDLRVQDVIDGLARFRRGFRGRMWLEIMLVEGVNDSVEHLVELRRVAWFIKPDRVQLNTVVRPPAEKSARPMTHDDLVQIQCLFGPNTDIADLPVAASQRRFRGNPDEAIAAVARGRPVTREDIAESLGIPAPTLAASLRRMVRNGRIHPVDFWGRTFYEPD
jgi:wyosine [tRNA(Phe)-imidazoG37] synthetase (radical SAM superfamily)